MTEEMSPPQPWIPLTNPVDIACLSKLIEELNEAAGMAARCIMAGTGEIEPKSKLPNYMCLEQEIADVLANIALVRERFDLMILSDRINMKKKHLKQWFKLIEEEA